MNKQTEEFMSIKNPQTLSAWTEVGKPHPHESAILHVTGEATYTDDILELQGTLHAALGLSAKAHARLRAIDLSKVKASVGVVAVYTADDIPGENQCGAIIKDDPVLADGLVQYVGQPIFVVIADSHDNARRAARQAVIDYEELPSILTPRAAHAAESYVLPPMHLTRGNPAEAFKTAPHKLKGQFDVGGQEQFYLEGQISYAIPKEGRGMHVYCSTQHPSEMQHHIAEVLNIASHDVLVECRRMGGGFGGKARSPSNTSSTKSPAISARMRWKCAVPISTAAAMRQGRMRAMSRITANTLRTT